EADPVFDDAARIAQPRHDRLDGETHREHPVREHPGQAHPCCDVIAVVDRVEVARRPRVPHQRLAGQVHGALGDDVSDLHHSSPPISRTEVAVTTWLPAASTISASLVTMAPLPTARTPLMLSCAVSSSPATIGRV